MKSFITSFMATALTLALFASPAAAAPLSVTLTTTDGRPLTVYLVSATPEHINYSTDPSGASPRTMLRTLIADMNISPPDGWGTVQAQFDAGFYADVIEPLAEFSATYAELRAIRDSVGSLSKLYHMIALKSVGDFTTLASELQGLQNAPLVLSEHLQTELQFLVGWALYGRESWERLEHFLSRYEDDTTPEEVKLRPFKSVGLSLSKVAELSYLRARLREHKGEREAALNDYYAAMTVNLGSQRWIVRESVLGALRLTHQMIGEQQTPNPMAGFEAHALALLADRTMEPGTMPAEYRVYLQRPEGIPEEGEKAEGDAKPADADAAPAPEDAAPAPEDAAAEEA